MKVLLAKEPRRFIESLPEGIDKAQILGALQQLAGEYDSVESWPTGDYQGGRYAVAGTGDQWKITYHLVEMDEPVVSVVSIKKRRTIHWGLRFYPKKD